MTGVYAMLEADVNVFHINVSNNTYNFKPTIKTCNNCVKIHKLININHRLTKVHTILVNVT